MCTCNEGFCPADPAHPVGQYTNICPAGPTIDLHAMLAIPAISNLSIPFATCNLHAITERVGERHREIERERE